jgi:hypothetical protein
VIALDLGHALISYFQVRSQALHHHRPNSWNHWLAMTGFVTGNRGVFADLLAMAVFYLSLALSLGFEPKQTCSSLIDTMLSAIDRHALPVAFQLWLLQT